MHEVLNVSHLAVDPEPPLREAIRDGDEESDDVRVAFTP
jgi:hypothetical protein